MSEGEQEPIFDSVEEAIEEIAAGRAIIVTDDEDRENEGDLIFASSKVTPEIVNMLILHARGLICVPCTAHHLQRLGINPMVQDNRESHRTDFAVSVDAAEGITTGISAYDRYRTIKVLGDPNARPDELVQPGHIFPLKAKGGGVLERAGHTEAAVDLASLAGLVPSGVLCEILNEDGTMARVPELFEFKKRFGLKMISIASLIEFRSRTECLVELVSERSFESEFGTFTMKIFRSSIEGREHFALVKGEIGDNPTLARVHAENPFVDLFHERTGNSTRIQSALKRIAEEGSGALVYIQRPRSEDGGSSKPSGRTGKMDLREYGIGAQILAALGLKKIRLMTKSAPNLIGLEGYGLEIVETVPL